MFLADICAGQMLFQDNYKEKLKVMRPIGDKAQNLQKKSFCCTKPSCLELRENKRELISYVKLTNAQKDTPNRAGGKSIFLQDTDPHLYLGGSPWSLQINLTKIPKM